MTKQIFWHTITSISTNQCKLTDDMRRRGIVGDYRITEREVPVEASYIDIIEPALEHCMKGVAMPPKCNVIRR